MSSVVINRQFEIYCGDAAQRFLTVMQLTGHCFLLQVVKVNHVISAANKLGISEFSDKWGKQPHLIFFLIWNQEFWIFVEFETQL